MKEVIDGNQSFGFMVRLMVGFVQGECMGISGLASVTE